MEDEDVKKFLGLDKIQGLSKVKSSEDTDLIDLGPTEDKKASLDDFEIVKTIGEGNFGKVYLAVSRKTNQALAIKVLKKDAVKQRKEVDNVMSERNVLVKSLNHPFLCKLHFSFQSTNKLYFVLDYINGGELFYHIQRERMFTEPRVRFYAAQIASALGYLHSENIIYRDLKPETYYSTVRDTRYLLIWDWQMKRAFQASLYMLQPNIVVILGDILDEGKWATKEDFTSQVVRFRDIFHHDKTKTIVKVVVGNHDIGFHYATDDFLNDRFHRDISGNVYLPSIYLWSFGGIHFVFANSIAFEGDNCDLCYNATVTLKSIKRYLDCLRISSRANPQICYEKELGMGLSYKYPYISVDVNDSSSFIYTRPILLQHFPLYRTSDSNCPTKPIDAMPKHLRAVLNRPKVDCLSKEATKQLLESLHPRLVLSGHTHYSCKMTHRFGNLSDSVVTEWSVASFSWRNLGNPGFLMLSISPTNYAINKCYLPTETRLIQIFVTGIILMIFIAFHRKLKRLLLFSI
ncbi:unnamed protein product [Heterobilharzia americana]|nr:unnamed protein product [Heterobilharzia americana]